jgi:hypothetical protein
MTSRKRDEKTQRVNARSVEKKEKGKVFSSSFFWNSKLYDTYPGFSLLLKRKSEGNGLYLMMKKAETKMYQSN